jgi:hypothetical protein
MYCKAPASRHQRGIGLVELPAELEISQGQTVNTQVGAACELTHRAGAPHIRRGHYPIICAAPHPKNRKSSRDVKYEYYD